MRHLLTIGFLIAAIALAIAGSAHGFVALIIVALIFEGIFWYRIFSKKKS